MATLMTVVQSLLGRSGAVDDAGGAARVGRRGPVLVWIDARVAPRTGAFAPNALPNAALDRAAVPTEAEGWARLNEFALTYDGYAYWDDLPDLAQAALATWIRDGSLPATLDERRGCLFYEQRRCHHFGDAPSARSLRYMWALATAIREGLRPPKRTPASPATSEPVTPAPAATTPAAATPARPEVVRLEGPEAVATWAAAHPDGLVTSPVRRGGSGTKLHRVGCPALGPTRPTAGGAVVRMAATEAASLAAWARGEGTALDGCKRCRP